MIKITVINESTAISDADVQAMLPAFDLQWNRDLAQIWGLEAAQFTFVGKGAPLDPAAWQVVFLDDSDQAGALAYHDLTNDGEPISKVFVKTILADKGSVSVGATHEICEMAVDPWLNGSYQDANGIFWASEICDPVEDDQYGYMIGSVLVTDFVGQAWYQTAHGPLDFKSHVTKAFEILSGGYAQKFDAAKGWVQITGPQAMRHERTLIAPDGSRRERRARGRKNWYRSRARR